MDSNNKPNNNKDPYHVKELVFILVSLLYALYIFRVLLPFTNTSESGNASPEINPVLYFLMSVIPYVPYSLYSLANCVEFAGYRCIIYPTVIINLTLGGLCAFSAFVPGIFVLCWILPFVFVPALIWGFVYGFILDAKGEKK